MLDAAKKGLGDGGKVGAGRVESSAPRSLPYSKDNEVTKKLNEGRYEEDASSWKFVPVDDLYTAGYDVPKNAETLPRKEGQPLKVLVRVFNNDGNKNDANNGRLQFNQKTGVPNNTRAAFLTDPASARELPYSKANAVTKGLNAGEYKGDASSWKFVPIADLRRRR